MRPLASSDYDRGHLNVLSVLTVTPDPGHQAWLSQFQALSRAAYTYYTIVIVSKTTDKIVAVGTVFLERKFLRGLGLVGHIEDIAVAKDQQGKKLGLRVIQALTGISEGRGCYKTILNCSETNIRELTPFVAIRGYDADVYGVYQHSTRNVGLRRKRLKWYVTLLLSCSLQLTDHVLLTSRRNTRANAHALRGCETSQPSRFIPSVSARLSPRNLVLSDNFNNYTPIYTL